jgi:hypothetical protein
VNKEKENDIQPEKKREKAQKEHTKKIKILIQLGSTIGWKLTENKRQLLRDEERAQQNNHH